MPAKLQIYRGLPGSGKTTMAEGRVAKYGGRLAGRDHIRKLLGIKTGVGTAKQENEVTELQERIILGGLAAGQTVHVDDMNLRSQYVKRLISLAESVDAFWEIEDLTYIDPVLCGDRDARRDRSVTREVINNLYKRFIQGKEWPLPVPESDVFGLKRVTPEPYTPAWGSEPAVLIDIDGTVALHDGVRGHHEYDKVILDQPNYPIIMAVRALINHGHFPLFVSGRPDSCREDTNMWIQKHVMVGPRHLHMRQTGDHRPDWLVKLEIFDNKIRDNYNVRMAFDDRDQVVRMYRELGITVLQVAKGNF